MASAKVTNVSATLNGIAPLDDDLATESLKPLLHGKTQWSRPAKSAIVFLAFVVVGTLTLAMEMQVLPRWASFDPRCSPQTIDIDTINYRSGNRFGAMLNGMNTLNAPAFRDKHEVLCTNENAAERKAEYCLPITSQDDPVFCAKADRISLLVRQSPLTLCRSSVLHLVLLEVLEELQETGAAPSINATMDTSPTSTVSIEYRGDIAHGGSLDMALQRKGYHLFEHDDKWSVCVAPTHLLASHLYDPDRQISSAVDDVLHVDLVNVGEITIKVLSHLGNMCSPNMVDVQSIEPVKPNRFYAILQSMKALPPPVFQGEHMALCSDQDRMNRGYSYCLPVSGRKVSSLCAGADRMELLAHPTASTRCFACILHMLLMDVYDELQATGLDPIVTFGTLLGAIRNGSVIPFTEDVDIAYSGTITSNGAFADALWKRGYHLFNYNIWRVCVAPTHPLASILYDPERSIAHDYEVPYVDLYSLRKTRYRDNLWTMDEAKGTFPSDRIEPFSQVTINGLPFNTVRDPHYLLEKEYGSDYLKPQPRMPQDATST